MSNPNNLSSTGVAFTSNNVQGPAQKIFTIANNGHEKISMSPNGTITFKGQPADCKNCKRSIEDHTREGKCLFDATHFVDGRPPLMSLESGPQIGGGAWKLNVMHNGDLEYIDVQGQTETLNLITLFKLVKELKNGSADL